MSDSRLGPSRADSAAPGPDSEKATPATTPPANQAMLGPFTARDLAVFAGVLVTFIGSVLPLINRFQGPLYPTLWNAGGLYFLGIGILLPLALAGLFVWRRLVPETSIRVGSLSLDQFASVVALLASVYFFLTAVTAGSAGGIVGFVGGAVLVAATVFARFIPIFASDFEGRAEVPAHVVARDAVAPSPRPKRQPTAPRAAGAPAPSAPEPQQGSATGAPWAGSYPHDDAEPASGGEPTPAFGAGVTSASAAAAAAGFAGATAAGAGVAALAAGAMAAGEGASHREEAEPAGDHVGTGDAKHAVHLVDEQAAPETAEPEVVAAEAPAQEAGLAEMLAGATGSAETSGPAEATGRAEAAEVPAQGAGIAEVPAGTAGTAEVTGPAEADAAVVSGDADGEAYGAPEPVAPEPVAPEPVAPAPVAPAVEPDFGHTRVMPAASVAESTPVAESAPAVDRSAGIEATQREEAPEPAYEAFWFAVSQQRSAVDPHSGLPVFTLEPGQWILALQDRGTEFLVQSQDGRVGVLRDLSGIERG